jgi:hypothetical protein
MFILGRKDASKNLIFLSVLFDRTCVGHLDFVNGVKLGINQMTGSVSPTSSCLLEAHLVGGFDDLVDRKKKFSMFASSGITEPFVMKDDLSSRNIHDPESVMCPCKRVLMDSGLFLPCLAFQS